MRYLACPGGEFGTAIIENLDHRCTGNVRWNTGGRGKARSVPTSSPTKDSMARSAQDLPHPANRTNMI